MSSSSGSELSLESCVCMSVVGGGSVTAVRGLGMDAGGQTMQ
jgi:hypothetical protein